MFRKATSRSQFQKRNNDNNNYSNNDSTMNNTMEIANDDRVIIQGRYLVYEQDTNTRFMIRGMAFPLSFKYNEDGWISVLKQIRQASPEINTLRLYHVFLNSTTQDNDNHRMDGFYQTAAELGFYLLVPLTAASGDGVLDRGKAAPHCYPPKLYHYGTRVMDSVRKHPNILGGVLGNEVLNSLKDWPSAPCLLAYARDLKQYNPHLPLIYTTQHDGISAVMPPAETAKLLLSYMTCNSNTTATVDILGINIESWCSSRQTFEKNEDGSDGSYITLYRQLENSTIPIIFSELGCSQILFNRDNELGSALDSQRRARDWRQVAVVEENMIDEFSGYIAYAYDGPFDFRMTSGGPWDGIHPLTFNLDMENYLAALKNASVTLPHAVEANTVPPTCDSIKEILLDCCKLDLMDVEDMPSYFSSSDTTFSHSSDDDIPSPLTVNNEETRVNHISSRTVFAWVLMCTIILLMRRRIQKKTKDFEGAEMNTTGRPQVSYSTFA